MSPLGIQIILHYWSIPQRYAWQDPPHANSPAVRELKDAFVNCGLMRRIAASDEHTPSEPDLEPVRVALEPYVEALCNISLPVQRWALP